MKSILTFSMVALALLAGGASQDVTAQGWRDGCPAGGPAYGMQRGGFRCIGPGGGFGGPRGFMQGQRGYRFAAMLADLDLTDEQRKQLYAIENEYRQKQMAQRQKMRENRWQIRSLSGRYPADRAEIDKLANVRGDLVTGMIGLRSEKHASIQQVLNDEQRELFNQRIRQNLRGNW